MDCCYQIVIIETLDFVKFELFQLRRIKSDVAGWFGGAALCASIFVGLGARLLACELEGYEAWIV